MFPHGNKVAGYARLLLPVREVNGYDWITEVVEKDATSSHDLSWQICEPMAAGMVTV